DTHELGFGRNILTFEGRMKDPGVDGVEVYGESPASQGQGDDANSWLSKKEVKGAEGKSSGNVLRVSDHVARTESSARAIAKNLFDAAQGDLEGTVKAIGAAKVRLGDAVKVSGMSDSSLNGTFKVTAVRHTLNVASGFTTSI